MPNAYNYMQITYKGVYRMKLLSKNRAQLLRLFYTNPEKDFYMQEIGRILNKKPGIFQRTINNMETEGILKSEYRANARYFKINKDYLLYKELKSIIFKTVGIIGSLQDVFKKLKYIKFVFIYGSFAKNKENYISDIDIMIIGNPDENILLKEINTIEKKLQREINYNLYSLINFKKDIQNINPFILEVLNNKKIMLIGEENELQKFLKK